MGAPELPNDPGEDDLRAISIVHQPQAASDDSDNEIMQDEQYEGYIPLAMDDNQTEYGYMRTDDNDEDNDVDNEVNHHIGEDLLRRIQDDEETTENEPIEVIHGDPNMPVIETADAEIEREVWSQPRPQELQIELDGNRTQQILNAMANFSLPNLAVPDWAAGVPEEHWKEELLQRIRQRKTSAETSKMQIDQNLK